MMKTKVVYAFIFVCVSSIFIPAQKATVKNDDAQQVLKNNAVNLTVEIGREANKITQPSQRIGLKIETVKILANFQKEIAIQTLVSAWQDVSSALENEKNSFSPLFEQRNEIISLAEKIAPAKAAEWKKKIEAEKESKDKESDKTEQTPRQKADAILALAISKAVSNPRAAVAEALSSLYKTEKMSLRFIELFNVLQEKNHLALLENLKKGLLEYTATRASSNDINDLGLVTSLISLGKISSDVERNVLIAFLLGSAKQILNPQTVGGKSHDELSKIYSFVQIHLRPVFARYSPQNLPTLINSIKEFSAFVPREITQNPIYSADEIEKQIDDAVKISGTKERDNQLTKIALWLLSRQMRSAENSLIWATKATFEIIDSETKQTLNDFIKIAEIENSVKDKDFAEAEKKAAQISTAEYRAWSLMSLGQLQKENPVTAQKFYLEAMQTLQKAAASAYKTQLALSLAALQDKKNPQTFLEILIEAIKFSNQVKETEDELSWEKVLSFYADFNEEIYFVSEDLRTLEIENLEIPETLGEFASTDWNGLYQITQHINDKNLRYRFQLLMAKTVLKNYSTQTKTTKPTL